MNMSSVLIMTLCQTYNRYSYILVVADIKYFGLYERNIFMFHYWTKYFIKKIN